VISRLVVEGDKPSEEWARSRRDVVLDDAYAYWSDYDGRILRTPKAGGTTEFLLEPSDCSVSSLAVDESNIYFGHNCPLPEQSGFNFGIEGRVGVIEKGTGVRRELARQQFHEVQQVAVQGGDVYWVFANPSEFTREAVLHVASPLRGDERVLLATGAFYLPFALSPAEAVWFNATDEELWLTSLNEGHSRRLGAASSVESVFVHGDQAYWVQQSVTPESVPKWNLMRLPLAGGEPELAFSSQSTEYVTTDGEAFFGAGHDYTEGSIVQRVMRWSPPGYEPEPLAAALYDPQGIAVDDEHVFVVDQNWEIHRLGLRLIRIDR
jgi:hypothetical protein